MSIARQPSLFAVRTMQGWAGQGRARQPVADLWLSPSCSCSSPPGLKSIIGSSILSLINMASPKVELGRRHYSPCSSPPCTWS